jgi:hypothetical protein
MVERWYFFIEAVHPQNVYYRMISKVWRCPGRGRDLEELMFQRIGHKV